MTRDRPKDRRHNGQPTLPQAHSATKRAPLAAKETVAIGAVPLRQCPRPRGTTVLHSRILVPLQVGGHRRMAGRRQDMATRFQAMATHLRLVLHQITILLLLPATLRKNRGRHLRDKMPRSRGKRQFLEQKSGFAPAAQARTFRTPSHVSRRTTIWAMRLSLV